MSDADYITQKMIEDAAEAVDSAKQDLRELKLRFAVQECPLNLGDVVECGNHRGKKMVVDRIGTPSWDWTGPWAVFGSVLNKDGATGKLRGELSSRDYKPVEKEQKL